ncbi:cytochrome-c peroxidase [Plastorhodobacter daqingensis]|uniref:Cytochrome-c peroxidase n=1 Tax=Plastorhodobacter daqingensis TaxID=1387281 RepID=A0ABW2UMA4_9RHOB
MDKGIRGLAIASAALLAAAGPVPADTRVPQPVTDALFHPVDPAEARLGQLLFYDPILSGNRNISCATCHHPRFATADGVSLNLGEGAIGLGPDRRVDPANPPEQRLPRNAPALFNLGAREFTVMFHDGRIESDPNRPSGLRTPLEEEMVQGFRDILSAQTMFPVLSADEMAGHYGENEISTAVRQGRITGPGGAWDLIARRVSDIPAYAALFTEVYPDIAAGRAIGFTDISDAIGAFVAFEWRSDDSPFDRHLRGESPLEPTAQRGMALFYGEAGCSDCHSGPFQTDHRFHAMGQPQIGPGKAERFESHQRDIGRMRVTGRPEDAYAFRTPSLRNVSATGPWGHAGAFSDLDAFLVHHLDPVAGLDSYRLQAALPTFDPQRPDLAVMSSDEDRAAIAAAVRRAPLQLAADDRSALLSFLESLTDKGAIAGRLGIPEAVPSGLPVER